MDIASILKKIKTEKPVIHHITNWVTIYDCANVVKTLGGSPVMAHAREEVDEMVQIASCLVLNIGTLTVDLVESMKYAAKAANKKGIPVVLDVCGAGATRLRDGKSFEILSKAEISVIKGNASEIARIAGEDIRTRGVDSGEVDKDLRKLAKALAAKKGSTIVITGKEDIIAGAKKLITVKNGHEMMGKIVGTGCMATSVIGTFAAVEKDLVKAAAAGLACFGIAGELAAKDSRGTGSFKTELFDHLYNLNTEKIEKLQRVE